MSDTISILRDHHAPLCVAYHLASFITRFLLHVGGRFSGFCWDQRIREQEEQWVVAFVGSDRAYVVEFLQYIV